MDQRGLGWRGEKALVLGLLAQMIVFCLDSRTNFRLHLCRLNELVDYAPKFSFPSDHSRLRNCPMHRADFDRRNVILLAAVLMMQQMEACPIGTSEAPRVCNTTLFLHQKKPTSCLCA